ncbi:DUF6113 family protein [Nocardioides sp. AX2bis]|uniref:DUF6113 family protein n=1 Tax=Nocardioides sp. AX2bis TaxID=2653157 RepID=UPI0012F33D9C|nr:DUF6113 family protein [Nocardioides sp. AX2bis]VXC00317.1 conserved membrane hypothetical protein [Nocardioides sp. AX2bis]
MRLAARLVLAVAWLIVGLVVGACAALLSSLWWGLLLGGVTTVALAVAARPGWGARVPLAVGWAVAVLRLALRRPEGDYVVGSDTGGYVLLALGLALVVAALVTVPLRARGTVAESASAPPAS